MTILYILLAFILGGIFMDIHVEWAARLALVRLGPLHFTFDFDAESESQLCNPKSSVGFKRGRFCFSAEVF